MDKSPVEILKAYWGHPGFRGSQAGIIDEVLDGADVMALMPTGGGKSICFQVPALMKPGLCIVVSPLMALMEDQVRDLNSRGIRALSLSGNLRREEVSRLLDNLEFGKYKFLYLSPERLQQDLVIERIKRLHVNVIAIDEAHCISQWGHDFRPAYLRCVVLRELHPEVPVIALTATGTPQVMTDIQAQLSLKNPVIFRDSVFRANIAYRVMPTEDKNYRLCTMLNRHPGSAIVYVSTRRSAIVTSGYLRSQGISAGGYHGGLAAKEKSKLLSDWLSGKQRVMVATNAFGMGIDKADVRLVVHLDIPETLENYFQEAGRAGRDGKPALAVLLLAPADIQKAREHYLGSLPTLKDLLHIYNRLNNYFQIAHGELPENFYPMKLTDFCSTYSLNIQRTYSALEILDRQGVISLSPQFWQKTTIRFTASKASLWAYLKTYPDFQPAVQCLVRTYGGLFDFETPVNLTSVSRKSKVSETNLLQQVKQMHSDGILSLEMVEGDVQVRFLVPREDEKTIYAFSGEVSTRLKVKKGKVKAMAAFLENTSQCRQLQLLAYFGEYKKGDCGVCDICLFDAQETRDTSTILRKKILASLQTGPKTSRQLLEDPDISENQLLHCLQELIHEGALAVGNENKYEIK